MHFESLITKSDTLIIPTIDEDGVIVQFKNTGISPAIFWFRYLNGTNYRNALTIVASSVTDSMDDGEKSMALWRLVSKSSFHYDFPYNHSLKDNIDPLALVTFPYLLCGEKSKILANLAMLAGLQARVINMKGHIVTEIYHNNSWHMYDADENVLFLTDAGEPASVKELYNHPELISQKTMIRSESDNLSRLSKYKNYILHHENNPIWTIDSFTLLNYQIRTMDIQLYMNDEVRFILNPSGFYKKMIAPRFLYETSGYMVRYLSPMHGKVIMDIDSNYIFEETLPYYIKAIEIITERDNDCLVLLTVKDRIQEKDTSIILGNLNRELPLIKTFNAPSDSDFYYSYKLCFIACDNKSINNITVVTKFDFNSLTFPFTSNKPVIVELFKGNSLSLKILNN